MDPMLLRYVQLSMAGLMFLMGALTFIIGIAILIGKTWGRDMHTLASQTARMAHKGLAEDVVGLVGNATALLSAINEMIRTTTGIGFFLTITGLILMGASFWMVLQIRFPVY